ncbi:MAG: hypothetical protein IPI67_03090 [Myxococcales bacterium]|nr:hypothetical protein [Myxococcales bacterium]
MRILQSLSCVALSASLLLAAQPSRAAEDAEEASATGKGITGGVLLGAEVVMLVEAAVKVKKPWAYAVGGIAGGIAGGVGGYFVETGSSDAKISIYMLAGGMALAIPTTVAVLSGAAYEPPANATEDRRPSDEPVAEPPQPGSAPAATSKAPARKKRVAKRLSQPAVLLAAPPPPALVGWTPRALSLSVPAVEVKNAYSRAELMQFGVKQATEVRVPVVSFVF